MYIIIKYGGKKMQTYNATNARANLFNILNDVNENHEPIQITGKKGNAIILSEADWRAIEETLYLSSVPGLIPSLKESLNEPIEDMEDANEVEW